MKPASTSERDARDETVALIHATVRRIPLGCVATYGDVADAAGLPGRARLVGRSLGAESADGEPLPWYRVIAAGGRIALPEGSEGRRRQLANLKREGVSLRDGRVDLESHRWQRHSRAPVLD